MSDEIKNLVLLAADKGALVVAAPLDMQMRASVAVPVTKLTKLDNAELMALAARLQVGAQRAVESIVEILWARNMDPKVADQYITRVRMALNAEAASETHTDIERDDLKGNKP